MAATNEQSVSEIRTAIKGLEEAYTSGDCRSIRRLFHRRHRGLASKDGASCWDRRLDESVDDDVCSIEQIGRGDGDQEHNRSRGYGNRVARRSYDSNRQ